MRVLRIDQERELALCTGRRGRASHGRDRPGPAGGGRRRAARPRGDGDRVKYVDEFRDAELGRALAGEILAGGGPRPPLQADGGLRRPHPLDLQVRDRRPAARQRRARPRARVPGLRDPDGPRRRRDRAGARGRGHPRLLRRHDAGPRVRRDLPRREGGRLRHPHGLLAARRAADREAEPGPRPSSSSRSASRPRRPRPR